jgi:hypothetical protein
MALQPMMEASGIFRYVYTRNLERKKKTNICKEETKLIGIGVSFIIKYHKQLTCLMSIKFKTPTNNKVINLKPNIVIFFVV